MKSKPKTEPGVMSFEDANRTVVEYCRRIRESANGQSETVPLLQALGRILAEPLVADRDLPPFPRAARDGYALRAEDLTAGTENGMPRLRVVGQVRAGHSYDLPVSAGEAVEIMTGAAVPEGADTVVMVEFTERVAVEKKVPQSEAEAAAKDDEDIIGIEEHKEKAAGASAVEDLVEIHRAVTAGDNIVPAGAEAKAGDEMLPSGTRLGPAQIALAAAAGYASVNVLRKPRVAILSTGDELVEVAEKPGPSQIRNSNSYSLAAMVSAYGGEPVQLPIAPDEIGKLTELIEEGFKADLLLLSGGVSMGKFDLVEQALKTLGAEFFFTGVQMQPGKPVVFGEVNRVAFFGLPGNPVSVMVTFEVFARQVVEALMGAEPSRMKSAQARLTKEFKTKTGLTRFLPASISGDLYDPEVEIVPWQGSGDMLAAARANCYLVVPPDRERLAKGEVVTVVLR